MAKQDITRRAFFVLLSLVLLSGCMLESGARSSTDAQPESGNTNTTFISAEGEREYTLATGAPSVALDVIVIIEIEQGELRLDLLDPNGGAVITLQGRPDTQVTRSASVTTDAQGNLRYRVSARGARNGGYQVLYQR